MTLEEKIAHIIQLLEQPGNTAKLMKAVIAEQLPNLTEEKIDIFIALLEGT